MAEHVPYVAYVDYMWTPMSFFTSYFSHCYSKIPDESNLKKKGVILPLSLGSGSEAAITVAPAGGGC